MSLLTDNIHFFESSTMKYGAIQEGYLLKKSIGIYDMIFWTNFSFVIIIFSSTYFLFDFSYSFSILFYATVHTINYLQFPQICIYLLNTYPSTYPSICLHAGMSFPILHFQASVQDHFILEIVYDNQLMPLQYDTCIF